MDGVFNKMISLGTLCTVFIDNNEVNNSNQSINQVKENGDGYFSRVKSFMNDFISSVRISRTFSIGTSVLLKSNLLNS